jgi:hypothetical protein
VIRYLFLFIIVFPSLLPAQRTRTFDSSVVNNYSNDFFCRNPAVDSIKSYVDYNQSTRVSIYTRSVVQENAIRESSSENTDYFNLGFLGDKYLFERKYGELRLPGTELKKVMEVYRAQRCNKSCSIEVVSKADSLRYIVKCYCPWEEEDDYDRVFTKVERGPKFKTGDIGLQQQIEVAFKEQSPETPGLCIDSVLIFKVLVDRKDSCLTTIELIEGNHSLFAQVVIKELKRACAWIAGEAGGRPVIAYHKVFVRLNKDKSITVSTPKW